MRAAGDFFLDHYVISLKRDLCTHWTILTFWDAVLDIEKNTRFQINVINNLINYFVINYLINYLLFPSYPPFPLRPYLSNRRLRR